MPPTPTIPGTETYVTPDIGAPSIAIATIHHGALRPPLKNPALSALRDEIQDTVNITAKYARTVIITDKGLILCYQ